MNVKYDMREIGRNELPRETTAQCGVEWRVCVNAAMGYRASGAFIKEKLQA